jgi:hypothetical protein
MALTEKHQDKIWPNFEDQLKHKILNNLTFLGQKTGTHLSHICKPCLKTLNTPAWKAKTNTAIGNTNIADACQR